MTARFTALASGSAGNACVIDADGFGVLLDFGLGPRTLAGRMADRGLSWRSISVALLTHTAASAICLRRQKPEEAIRHAELGAKYASELHDRFTLAKTEWAWGKILYFQGQRDAAVQKFDSARATFEELDTPYELARLLFDMGVMRDEPEEATLTIRSRIDGTEKDYTIRREKINVASVKGWRRVPGAMPTWDYFIDPQQKIAYLLQTNFTTHSSDEMRRALVDAKAHGSRGLILDMRYNPGGQLVSATEKILVVMLAFCVSLILPNRSSVTELIVLTLERSNLM